MIEYIKALIYFHKEYWYFLRKTNFPKNSKRFFESQQTRINLAQLFRFIYTQYVYKKTKIDKYGEILTHRGKRGNYVYFPSHEIWWEIEEEYNRIFTSEPKPWWIKI